MTEDGRGDATDDVLNMKGSLLDLFGQIVKAETYRAGEIIFYEGSAAERFFIIREGEIEIRKVIDRQESRFKPISVLTKGEFFGEMAVFLDQSRTADAVARTDVVLLGVGKKEFAHLLQEEPNVAYRAMESVTYALMDRLRNTTKELTTVYEAGRLITSARSLPELADSVMESVLGAVEQAESACFVIWNEFNDEYDIYRQHNLDLNPGAAIAKDDGLVGWFLANRETFLSFDLPADGRPGLASDSPYRGRSIVASPFFLQERLLGFMCLLSSSPSMFSHNHAILLSAIGAYVSVALDNLRHMQEEIDRGRLSQAKTTIPF